MSYNKFFNNLSILSAIDFLPANYFASYSLHIFISSTLNNSTIRIYYFITPILKIEKKITLPRYRI